jgi:carboxymethylenebutenolidase
METITIRPEPAPMKGYLSVPEGTGPWPGVVVIHDALGMTSDVARQVDWLGGEGFLALAPDLYSRAGRLRCMFKTMRAISAGEGPAFDDVSDTRRWLVERDDCTGSFGVIGFCMGGGLALALATTGDFDASSPNYGDLGDYSTERFARACPIVASYGGRDRSMRKVPAKLEAALSANDTPHDIKVYPEAGHGFLNNHDPSELSRWFDLAGRLIVTGYDEAAASDARLRITTFFTDHLRA